MGIWKTQKARYRKQSETLVSERRLGVFKGFREVIKVSDWFCVTNTKA